MPLSEIRAVTRLDLGPLLPNHNAPGAALALGDSKTLDFAGHETQHSTHGIHPYVAAINPPLAAYLIDHYVPKGESVLDPFCGGGGILVEALLNGRNPTGYDVNPLAYVLSLGKTKHIPTRRSVPFMQDVLSNIKPASPESLELVDPVVRYWYFDETLKYLITIGELVSAIPDSDVRNLFRVALSATARDSMLTYRGEVRLRKLQDKDLERFSPNVPALFRKRIEIAVTRASELPRGEVCVFLQDIRKAPKTVKYHTVITSPPYGDDTNGVGYFQFSRNMLHVLGYSLPEIKSYRESFLGENGSDFSDMPKSPSLEAIGSAIAGRSDRLFKDFQHFYYDYYTALAKLCHITRERIIIIIGDRTLARTFVSNAHITTEMMSLLGWNLEHYYSREIRKKRITNLGSDGGGISFEHILVFKR
jgi:DNA modification methylase